MKPHYYVAIGAEPFWKNHAGEQVMKVWGEYRTLEGDVVGTCWQLVTTSGSNDVRRNAPN